MRQLISNKSLLGQWMFEIGAIALASAAVAAIVILLINFDVRVGALVTILTIALDPFAQQLVQLQEKIKDDETRESQASIATADYYSRGVVTSPLSSGQGNKGNFTEPDSGMDISIKLSYTDVDPGLRHQVVYNCSTADCEYGSFDSLAVCSRCHDITTSLKKCVVRRKKLQIAELVKDQESPNGTNDCTEYYLPNGLYLSNLDGDDDIYSPYQLLYMVMFGTGDQNSTIAMNKMDTLIWSQSFITVDESSVHGGLIEWPEPNVVAEECALYYCIKRYTAAVKNGTLVENSTTLEKHKRIQDSWQIYPDFNVDAEDFPEYANESLAWDPAVAAFQRSNLMLGDTSRNWSIDSAAVYSIGVLMKQTFTKCMEARENCTEEDDLDPPHGFVARRQSNPPIADILQHDPGDLFEKMARGMSVAIRNGADEGQSVTGTTFFPVTVYRVAWPWIILHLLATLGSLVFLIATIWSTYKAKLPAWKSSELAVFSQVAAANGVFSGGETYHELEEKAKDVPVVLLEKRDREEGIVLEDRGVSGDVSGEDIMLPTRSTSKTGSLFRRGRNRGEYESVRVDSP